MNAFRTLQSCWITGELRNKEKNQLEKSVFLYKSCAKVQTSYIM